MPDGPDGDWMVSLESMRAGKKTDVEQFGSKLVEAERGRVIYHLPVTPAVGGGSAGGVHGGIIAAMAGLSAVSAANSVCKVTDRPKGTAELNVSYLRPGIGATLIYTATVLKKGRSIAVIDVNIHNDTGTLVAKARVSCSLDSTAPPSVR